VSSQGEGERVRHRSKIDKNRQAPRLRSKGTRPDPQAVRRTIPFETAIGLRAVPRQFAHGVQDSIGLLSGDDPIADLVGVHFIIFTCFAHLLRAS